MRIIGKAGGFVQVKLPSGEIRKVLSKCRATCGMLSNRIKNVILGKREEQDGRKWPRVRGVAMNPVDHPLGGGEGKHQRKASSELFRSTIKRKEDKKQENQIK